MRIGFDLDGVLSNFVEAYERLFIGITGLDLFGKHKWPNTYPCTWEWPQHYGYTDADAREVWAYIKYSPTFWTRLQPYEPKTNLRLLESNGVDLVFLTDRPGIETHAQTETWLREHYHISNPNILVTADKGGSCLRMSIDAYIDDRAENVVQVEKVSPKTFVGLLDRPYNKHLDVKLRVPSVDRWLKEVDIHVSSTP